MHNQYHPSPELNLALEYQTQMQQLFNRLVFDPMNNHKQQQFQGLLSAFVNDIEAGSARIPSEKHHAYKKSAQIGR